MALTQREEEILACIEQNPMISQQELASMLGITRSGTAAHIFNLMRKGYIQGKGYIVSPAQYVAVVGGVNIDIHGMASEHVVGLSSNVGHVVTSVGGIARNVAYNLTSFGIKNYLVALYGDDANGKLFKEDARHHNIDITRSLQVHDKTSQYLSVVSASGEQIVALDDMGISSGITPQFLQQRLGLFTQAAITVLDTSLSQEAIAWLCEHVHKPIYARVVSVNKAQRLVSVLDRIDTLVLAATEAQLVSGIDVRSVDDAVQCVRVLCEAGVRTVALLLNASTAVFAQEHEIWLACIPEELLGRHLSNGAPTAILSTLAWQHIEQEHTFQEIISLAMASASLVLDSVEATCTDMTAEQVERRTLSIEVQRVQ